MWLFLEEPVVTEFEPQPLCLYEKSECQLWKKSLIELYRLDECLRSWEKHELFGRFLITALYESFLVSESTCCIAVLLNSLVLFPLTKKIKLSSQAFWWVGKPSAPCYTPLLHVCQTFFDRRSSQFQDDFSAVSATALWNFCHFIFKSNLWPLGTMTVYLFLFRELKFNFRCFLFHRVAILKVINDIYAFSAVRKVHLWA